MATTPRPTTGRTREVEYPTSDGKPMAETDVHRQIMFDAIQTLQDRYSDDPNVYVSGNLLLFYEEGNRRKHVSPDVLVAFGVPKQPLRDYYLLWEEGKSPDVVIEITSKTTRREDETKKWVLYRDVLKIPEYFQFDPTEDYLKPSLKGQRLVEGEYMPIAPVAGRLPSELLGLHLGREGLELRFYDPATGGRLPTREERITQAQAAARDAQAIARDALDERDRLRQEIEALKRRLAEGG